MSLVRAGWRVLVETDRRALYRFAASMIVGGSRAVSRFRRRERRGVIFPAFLFLSVTDNCNLRCQGCWVSRTTPSREMDLGTLHNVIDACAEQGASFFGILGGEPLLHRGLFELFERHPRSYFLLFTNGTLITDDVARRLRRLANVSPLISVEGLADASDERRGGRDIYARTMEGLDHCRRNRLVTGVATSLCQTNYRDLASLAFLRDMARRGAHYAWYYIYRPAGERPTPELALTAVQIAKLRRFLIEARRAAPLFVVDAYWDQDGRALCPAATGISHHISPDGWVEPCPPIQLAVENIGDGRNLFERIARSSFLRDFRKLAAETTRGCILMERPDLVARMAQQAGAQDSSGRGTFLRELSAMSPLPSHHCPGDEVAESSLPYRLGKRRWFFGLGAYG